MDAERPVINPPAQLALSDDGRFPNSRLTALMYRCVEPAGPRWAERFEIRFAANDWSNGWRDGIFEFHHYHSTAHEVLGVYAGSARVQLGGPRGEVVEVVAGDVIVIPAGVGHCNIGSDGLSVVGAYAGGRSYDLLRGRKADRPAADRNIAEVPLPKADPVYGEQGPLTTMWS